MRFFFCLSYGFLWRACASRTVKKSQLFKAKDADSFFVTFIQDRLQHFFEEKNQGT
jgi:hypothetical protein